MTQRRNEEGVPPPGHIIDDTGRVRRVLGTLPLTADGCVAGIGARVINPIGEEWVACVRNYAHEPGAEDDDPNCLLADCRAPLADSNAGGGGISKEQGMGQLGAGRGGRALDRGGGVGGNAMEGLVQSYPTEPHP